MKFEFLANAAFVMVVLLNSLVFGGGILLSFETMMRKKSVLWGVCAVCFVVLFCLNIWLACDVRNLLLVP